MPNPDEEQRLEQTKMSFGEHLEELRSALFKSLIALTLGFIVGLCIGFPLVNYIQDPLRRSLREHYLRKAEAKQLAWLRQQEAAGEDVPADLEQAAREMAKSGLAPNDVFVSVEELAEELSAYSPDLAKAFAAHEPGAASAAPSGAPPGMIRLRLYEPIENDARLQAIALNSYEPFTVYLKASFAAGLVLASPFIFYFIWEFIAAGLYRSEKKYVHIYLPVSLGLFLAGAGLAYYFAFDYVLQFLFWFHEKMGIDPYPRLSDWITTVVLLPLGFGVSFQLPLAMLLLERLGIFTVDSYVRKWRIAILVIAVMSMVLTPGGDIQSMMLMFVPLTGLYFLGILMCKRMPGGSMRSPLRDRPPAPRPEESAGS